MGMGGKGSSEAHTQSSSVTSQTTVNNVDNSIRTSDMGAIAAAQDISGAALALAGDAGDSIERVSIASIDNARDLADTSSERIARFAGDALSSNSNLAGDAIASNSNLAQYALDFVNDLFGTALNAQTQLTDQNIAGLTTLATQNSATSDDRLQRVVLYAIVAVAAIFVLPRVFK